MNKDLQKATEQMQRDLIAAASDRDRCGNLRIDPKGLPYCGKLTTSGYITPNSRSVCDTASLQLWCLDPSRHSKCIQYN